MILLPLFTFSFSLNLIMADDNNQEKIMAEFDAICELYEEASAREDDVEMIKYGKQFAEFISVNYAVLNMTEAMVDEYKQGLAVYEKAFEKDKIAAEELEKANREVEESKQKYYELLLKLPPDGKKRTEH